MSGRTGELEGAKPASNQICRPEKPAKQAFSEQNEDFCAGKAGAKVTAASGYQKSPEDLFDNLKRIGAGRSPYPPDCGTG
jgi:hypothetical protein